MWKSARSRVRNASIQLGTSDFGPLSGFAALTTIAAPARETRRNSQPAINVPGYLYPRASIVGAVAVPHQAVRNVLSGSVLALPHRDECRTGR